MTSALLSRASALVLSVGGLTLLFAPEVLGARSGSGVPDDTLWIAQLLGAGWLGLAALDWLSRAAVLGGIYGRPVVMANLATYFIGALVLLKAATRSPSPAALWAGTVVAGARAAAYGALLLRGPFGAVRDGGGA